MGGGCGSLLILAVMACAQADTILRLKRGKHVDQVDYIVNVTGETLVLNNNFPNMKQGFSRH